MPEKRWNGRQKNLMSDVYACKIRINRIEKIKDKMLRKAQLYTEEQEKLKSIIEETMNVVAQHETLTLKTIKSKAKYGKHWNCDNEEVVRRFEKLRSGRPMIQQIPIIHQEVFNDEEMQIQKEM